MSCSVRPSTGSLCSCDVKASRSWHRDSAVRCQDCSGIFLLKSKDPNDSYEHVRTMGCGILCVTTSLDLITVIHEANVSEDMKENA